MDLELDKSQKMLRDSAREFLRRNCPPDLVREFRADARGFPPELWQKMAGLGWQGVMIPEAYGGTGGDFMDLVILLESMGEVCCATPFFSSIVLGGISLLLTGTEEQKRKYLPGLAEGGHIIAFAMDEPEACHDPDGIQMKAAEDGGMFRLRGTKLFVDYAPLSDTIITVARRPGQGDENFSLFLVDAADPGTYERLKFTLLQTLDYVKTFEVTYDDVAVAYEARMEAAGNSREFLRKLLDYAAVAKSAELVGVLQSSFNMSLAYAKNRRQFGRPIGSFQAIQHHLANMVIDVDGARYATYRAAWRASKGLGFSKEAAVAKAWVSEAAHRVTMLGLRIHGAISYTDEHDMHLYYRKARTGALVFGDAGYHLERVASAIGL